MVELFKITNLGENILEDNPASLEFVEQEILFLLEDEGPLTVKQITSNLQVEGGINIISFRVQKTLDRLDDKGTIISFDAPLPSKAKGRLSHPTLGFQDTATRARVGFFSPEERLEDQDLSEFIRFSQPDVKFRTDKMSPN